jgi:hypothetical protein
MNSIGHWKNEREEHIEKLREKVTGGGSFLYFLALVFPAVREMPDWNTFLNSLFVNYLVQEFDDNVDIGDNDTSELVQ